MSPTFDADEVNQFMRDGRLDLTRPDHVPAPEDFPEYDEQWRKAAETCDADANAALFAERNRNVPVKKNADGTWWYQVKKSKEWRRIPAANSEHFL